MMEETLVRMAAPTLAGIKTGKQEVSSPIITGTARRLGKKWAG